MRTTISLADELLLHAKRRARATGRTLGEVIEAALRRELAFDPQASDRPDVPVFRGDDGPRPGVDLSSNRALHELLDDDRPLETRR